MKKLSLASKIMIGMALGIIVGLVISYFKVDNPVVNFLGENLFKLGGKLFLNMFRMIVAPVVLFSMIRGVTTMNNPSLLGRVGAKTLVIFAVTTVLASVMGIYGARLVSLGAGSSITPPAAAAETVAGKTPSLMDTLSKIVPQNIFESLVEANMLQIIFIAVIVGLALIKLAPNNELVTKLIDEVDAINVKIIELTLQIAPYGVFCLMAETFYNFGFKALLPLISYILCIVVIIAILLFVIYPIMLIVFARLSPVVFFKKYYPVMIFAFSSSSSNATLPLNIKTVSKNLGVNESVGTFILSLGATINMNGTAIMQSCAAIFVANLYGMDLTLAQIVQVIVICLISSIGTAGMPGAGIIMLGLVLSTIGIPVEGTAIILGVDRIIDMFRTTGNITGDAVTALIVASSEKQLDRAVFESKEGL